MNENKKDVVWASVAHNCAHEYNDTVHSVTQFSPNYIMNGVVPDVAPMEFFALPDLVADRQRAYKNSVRSHNANKVRYDEKK